MKFSEQKGDIVICYIHVVQVIRNSQTQGNATFQTGEKDKFV